MEPGVLRYLRIANNDDDEEATFENRIWIPDSQLGYRLCTVLDDAFSDVLVGFRDEQGYFEKKRIAKSGCESTSRNCLADDLCCLTEPNNATVLDALTRRYQNGIIHTYSGLFCVVMNPWRNLPIYAADVMEEYRCSVGDHYPHVYSVAQEAYDGILRGGRNQSILITGESGAGKTENTKKIIDFILHDCGSEQDESLGHAVVTSGILLEAFGNARTTHNTNSSRFGKFIKIEFDENGKLVSSQIECYLLEKSRVVSQNEGDRNFHIFYQMLSEGLPPKLKQRLNLKGGADHFKFLNQGGPAGNVKDVDDVTGVKATMAAMARLDITDTETEQIFELVAACAMIGEIKFGERSGMDLSFVERQAEVDHVADLLQLKSSRIVDALTSPTIKIGDKLIRKNQNLKKTLFSASAMAKAIYERIFNWLLEKCNDVIGEKNVDMTESAMRRFIGVLDIAGFEIMQKNSFEQFCINFTNEKLQQFFNHFMFIKEQAEYEEEGITWNHINFAEDLQPTIALFEKPMGMFSLLEEECVVPNGSDQSLLEKFCGNLSDSAVFSKAKQSKRNKLIVHFTVKHYAGSVDYNIDSWIEKNRDVVESSVLALLAESTQPLLKSLFPPVQPDLIRLRRGTICNASVTYTYRNQLQSLLDCLNLSAAHFVRCVIPNYERVPGKVDGPLILHQLKCNGVLEGIRICRKGFPSRIGFFEFLRRYSILGGASFAGFGREGCRQLLQQINFDKERYAVGKTRIFFKVGVISQLEEMRRDYLSSMLVKLQAYARWHLAIKDADTKRNKNAATTVIQDNVRVFASVAQWDWYRILCLVRPLIPKDRERLRIQELEEKIKLLEEENQKIHKENERTNRKMTVLEQEHLRELAELRKEKLEMEEKLRRQVEETLAEYHEKTSFLENQLREIQRNHSKELADSKREMQRKMDDMDTNAAREKRKLQEKMDEEMESIREELEAALKAKAELQRQQEQNSSTWKSRCDMAEKSAATLKEAMDKLKADKDNEMSKMRAEMEQNEDIFGLLEKKYNEQHQKVMKMNEMLRNYEREMEEAKMTNKDLEKELTRAQDALEKELGHREMLLKEHGNCTTMIADLEAQIQKLNNEITELRLLLARLENESEDEKHRNQRQNDTILELQKLISELNDKTARFDQQMLEERNKRRKLEKEKEMVQEDLQHLKDTYDKMRKKYEELKEEFRQRENLIRQMERKLEDKEALMKDCVKELKDAHKARISEIEEKIEDMKRKNSKLESENTMQKMKIETAERESSVDSDYGYGTSSYRSALGRQYSLTSFSSFSSIRTLNRRRETEPEISSSMYLPRRRESVDFGSVATLPRTNSTTNIDKDRKISELERQIQSLNTDINIQKRELEVYKTSMSTVEGERDRLLNTNRGLQVELENVKRQMDRSEANADSLAMRLKRAQEELEQWKKKHEELIQESKNEILIERKRATDRMQAVQEEARQRQSKMQSLENAREDLHSELYRCQAELDRALATVRDLEQNVQSQEMLGGNMESNYKAMVMELEALREENNTLKARNRRQSKQIELLTQQDSTNDIVNHMESKVALG